MKNGAIIITEAGVSASVRKTIQFKKGRKYSAYIVDYYLLGKRQRLWRSTLEEAQKAARRACLMISKGEQQVLQLKNDDRLAYLRAVEALGGLGIPLDTACRDFAEAARLLGNIATLTNAAQFYVKQHRGIVSKTVAEAVNELLAQIETEQQSTTGGTRRKHAWYKLLHGSLHSKLARDFNCAVTDLSSAALEPWLVSIKGAERTRRNVRDCIAFFIKWCKARNYLPKDADPLANVQNFRKRKRGLVQVLWAEDLARLMAHAPEEFIPYLAIRAFAGLRDSEARALEWQHIDLKDGWLDVPDHIAKQADNDNGVARMVKIRPALLAWLQPRAKKAGPVCPYANTAKVLARIGRRAAVTIPHNALRHSFISAAVTVSNDLNAVSVEAGNSPTIIRQHYWRKMRPEQATAWFNVMPDATANIVALKPDEQSAAA